MICKHMSKLIWSSIPGLISLSIPRHKPIWYQDCCIIVDSKKFQVVFNGIDSYGHQMNFALFRITNFGKCNAQKLCDKLNCTFCEWLVENQN